MAEPNVTTRVRELVEPPLAADGFEVVDVVFHGAQLRVTVDRPEGVDLEAVSEATKVVSGLLDTADAVPGTYSLEVSSPGIERPLRTPDHFRRFVGHEIVGRTLPGSPGDRRFEGRLESADDDGVVVAGRRLAYADIERARTRFVWPASAPSKPGPSKPGPSKAGPTKPAQSQAAQSQAAQSQAAQSQAAQSQAAQSKPARSEAVPPTRKAAS